MKKFSCLVGLLFLIGCHSVHKKALLPRSHKPVVMSKTGPITEPDLGVPIYPGAVVSQKKSFISHASNGAVQMASTTLKSTDPVNLVEGYYRKKLGASAKITNQMTAGGELVDMIVTRQNKQIRVEIAPRAHSAGSIIIILTQSKF